MYIRLAMQDYHLTAHAVLCATQPHMHWQLSRHAKSGRIPWIWLNWNGLLMFLGRWIQALFRSITLKYSSSSHSRTPAPTERSNSDSP